MIDTDAERDTVTEADLDRIDTTRLMAEGNAAAWQDRADRERQRAGALAVAREFLASRLGRPWDEVGAEAAAEAVKATAEREAAEENLRRITEHRRDLVGHVRVLRAEAAELRATDTTEIAEEN